MFGRFFVTATAMGFLTGCSGGGGDTATPVDTATDLSFVQQSSAQTGFLIIEEDGTFSNSTIVEDGSRTHSFKGEGSSGYTYQLGRIADVGYGGFAGISPASTVVDPPVTGTVAYQAAFIVDAYVDIHSVNGSLHAISGVGANNDILLTADFDANTLTGSAPQFSVDGVLDSVEPGLSGTVQWLNVEGSLTGLVGSDQVIGAFHGRSDEVVFVGGLIGKPVP